MTVTDTPPDTAPTPAPAPPTDAPTTADVAAGLPVGESVFTTADHKRIGVTFIVLSLLGFLGVRGVGAALGLELTAAGVDIVGDDSRRLYSLYETGIVMVVLQPLWIGLASFLLPLQIGASRLAFPRIQALALWTSVGGGALFALGHLLDPPPGIGLSDSVPLQAPIGGVNRGTDLLIASFALLAIATILAAGNLLVTALTGRTEGMTLGRMPLFAWGVVAAAAGTLLATPVFLGGVLLLHVDLHYAGVSVFGAPGADLVWQHALWLYGRPEIFLLSVPALGAAGDIVVGAARAGIADPPQPPVPASMQAKAPPPPTGHGLAAGSLCAIAVLSFLTFAQDRQTLHALVLPTAAVVTALVVLPIGQLALLWLGTLGKTKAKPTLALGFVAAALLLVVAGVANAVVAAVAGVRGGAFASGQLELVAIGLPTVLAAGALQHWGKKLFGAPLLPVAGGLELLTLTGGTLAVGVGTALAGYSGAGRHLKDWNPGDTDLQGPFTLAAVGHVLLVIGGLVLLADVLRAIYRGSRAEPVAADLADGVTLEWATPTPVPDANFVSASPYDVPDVRSPTPTLDLRTARDS